MYMVPKRLPHLQNRRRFLSGWHLRPDSAGCLKSSDYCCPEGEKQMRRLDSYIRKYGDRDGRIIYRLLQSQAAHARWKAWYRDNRS